MILDKYVILWKSSS